MLYNESTMNTPKDIPNKPNDAPDKRRGASLGPLGIRFFAYVQSKGTVEEKTAIVETGELQTALGLTPVQERKLLSRLSRAEMIARVRRRLYLAPKKLPSWGKWSPDMALAINTLMRDKGGRYQICGPNMFNEYGFSTQVPVLVYAYNDKISGSKKIGSVYLELIKVGPERLGDTEDVRWRSGEIAVYSSRVRTLVDAVYDWPRFGYLTRVYRWIRRDLREDRITAEALVECTLRYGDIATIRRIGTLLETLGVDDRLLEKLEKRLMPTMATIPWLPKKPKRGKLNKRWGVIINGE